MSEQNMKIIRQVIEEVWNRSSDSAVGELVAGGYVGHGAAGEGDTRGSEGYRQYFQQQRAAFPDIHYRIEDLVAAGDKVAARWTAAATHLGAFQGIPPTARKGNVSGISIFRIANGQIAECWTNYDALGLLQQLGLVPAPRVGE